MTNSRNNNIESESEGAFFSRENREGKNPESSETTYIVEQSERVEDRAEQAVVNNAERLEAKATGVEQGIKGVEKVLPPDRVSVLKERFNETLDRAAEIAKFALLTTVASKIPGNMRRSRVDVERSGIPEYSHPDKKTTAIIEYMSGKADLPREQKLELVEDALRNINSKNKAHKRLVEAREALLPRMLNDNLISPDQLRREEESVSWFIPPIPSKTNFNPMLYESLWQMEMAAGNPRIEFESGGRAFYETDKHTMHISSPLVRRSRLDSSDTPEVNLLDNFTAEAAHALQWHRNRENQDRAYNNDWERIKNQTVLEGKDQKSLKDLTEVRDRIAYTTPGFVEHEAHQKIEPALWKKFEAVLRRLREKQF